MPGQRKLISIIIPCFNEALNVERAYEAVAEVFADALKAYDAEILFLDNCSTDQTFAVASSLAERDRRVKAVRFSRNFGFNRSVITGYRLAQGDAAIQLDCDLQDPPEMFVEFVKHWEAGHDVVVGQRRKRIEPWLLRRFRQAFYRLLAAVSDDNLMVDGGDFRLVSRSVIDGLRWIDDVDPNTRGLTSFFARNQIGLPYDRQQRVAGESKFPLAQLIKFAVGGFVAHSTLPLRLASIFGMLIASSTALIAVAYTVGSVLFGAAWPAGFTTQVVLQLVTISVLAIFLGIIGEYLGQIHRQLKKRPTTLIVQQANLADHQVTALMGHGYRIPEAADYSVTSVDDKE